MIEPLEKFSDLEIVAQTKHAIRIETEATSVVLRYFREIERRSLYLRKGYASLFQFAVEALGYCAGSAQLRINAMKLISVVPGAEQKIEDGELSLTAASKIQTFFNAEEKLNKVYSLEKRAVVVADCLNKSTRDVECELAKINPEILQYETTKAIGENRFQLTFTITRELEAKLRKLKGLLAHSKPCETNERLFEVLVEMGLERFDPIRKAERAATRKARSETARPEQLKRERANESESQSEIESKSKREAESGHDFNIGSKQQHEASSSDQDLEKAFHAHEMNEAVPMFAKEPGAKRSRYIPASIRTEVWLRNRGEGCEFVDHESGRRCCSQHALQIDHVKSFALGGANTTENLRVLCAKHNRFVWRTNGRSHVRADVSLYLVG